MSRDTNVVSMVGWRKNRSQGVTGTAALDAASGADATSAAEFVGSTFDDLNAVAPMDEQNKLTALADLYPSDEAIAKILGLLGEMRIKLRAAEAQLHSGDLLASDNSISLCVPIVVELFCFRSKSDGFELCVSSLLSVFRNATLLSVDQVRCLLGAINLLLSAPFLSSEEALDLVGPLEDAGLQVTDPVLGSLLDSGDGDGVDY